MKFAPLSSTAEFQAQSFAIDTCSVEYDLEILNQLFSMIIPRFIPALSKISTDHEHTIRPVSERAYDHIR